MAELFGFEIKRKVEPIDIPSFTPKAADDESGTKYKRPRLAKFSKWIRGRFGRKKNVSTTDI